MKISLTFDNGPDLEVTPFVLDRLAEASVRATFFVIGEHLTDPAKRKLVERARAEGHQVGNHTYTHATPLGWINDAAESVREIDATEQLLERGVDDPMLFRPTAGGEEKDRRLLSAAAVRYLRQRRLTCVLWNNLPRDWTEPNEWLERAMATARAQSWSVLVLHDIRMDAMSHLPRFLDEARAADASFVQTFPDDCVPIRLGVPQPGLADYVAARAARRA